MFINLIQLNMYKISGVQENSTKREGLKVQLRHNKTLP